MKCYVEYLECVCPLVIPNDSLQLYFCGTRYEQSSLDLASDRALPLLSDSITI